MTSLTEFNIGNPSNTIPFHIAVTEGTVKMGYLLMMDMVEENGLIDGYPREDRKDGKEDTFGLNPKSIVGNYGKKKNDDNNNKKANPPPHTYNLYLIGLESVK